MRLLSNRVVGLAVLATVCGSAQAQIYSPNLLREGQPDSTNLTNFADTICKQAHAKIPREKAEAIWRFFLTDGRFVKPGFWYHIAGWTYEEPTGEVLDPIKLLNSYGFGLCYHIAPLLEAVYQAAGFPDARVWFLTGHTVTEVFYDGAYHYFDSDMMGYNVEGTDGFKGKPVVSVQQLEQRSDIILDKLTAPNKVKPGTVENPWYPADVRASAMKDLSDLFTTTDNNFLYPYTRYASGHSMAFTLRPGEKLIRYFHPEEPGLFYLPYKFDGAQWTEFPQEIAEYHIRTADGPRSQKDERLWATGRIEYTPPEAGGESDVRVIDMPSPYVVIDARFNMKADLPSSDASILVETSIDGGKTWDCAGELKGPLHGPWSVEPRTIAQSAHGRKTAVSGWYGYKVRITERRARQTQLYSSLQLLSRIQINPRALPFVSSGVNHFVYSAGNPEERVALAASLDGASQENLNLVAEKGQSFLLPVRGKTGSAVYKLECDGLPLTGFDAGARFLDLQKHLAPDKLTAETRHTDAVSEPGGAFIEWSTSPTGPFHKLWSYSRQITWRDRHPVDQLLRWPEVFEQVRDLPANTSAVWVRFGSSGPAMDSIRLSVYKKGSPAAGILTITQSWREHGVPKQHIESLSGGDTKHTMAFAAGDQVENEAVIFEARN